MQISNGFCAQRVISRSLLYKQKVNNYTLIDEQKTGLLAIQKSLQIREQTEMEVKTNGEIWTINLNVHYLTYYFAKPIFFLLSIIFLVTSIRTTDIRIDFPSTFLNFF